ncbi:MAG: hypothetical protein P4L39_08100 [Humidesulfovibrio sp.]|nr:hypothetical protein [Humidesulfovibrio sp.]
MTRSPKIDASASDVEATARAEAEMAGFTAERDACVARCRELMAAEDPANGIFHAAEIFRLRQDKLRLEVEMEFRRKKINRIRLGMEDTSIPTPGGLPF